MSAVEVTELRKSYGDYEAVRGISFAVQPGESVAFLGPNGAGKTTTVEILEGYRPPSSGRVSVLGIDPLTGGADLRRRVGIVLQEAGFPVELTAAEVIEAWRRLYPDPLPLDEVLHAVGLESRAGIRIKSLSGGEKRRLDLALGIVGRPEVLFLDEPTTGFDPSARRAAWELISSLVGGGLTLFLTSHYLEEAQTLADRIIIIANGQIVAEGTPDEIGGRGHGPGSITFVMPPGSTASHLPSLPGDCSVTIDDGIVRIETIAVVEATNAVTGWALAGGLDLVGFRVERPTLEDAYLSIVGGLEGTQEARP